MKAVVGSEDSHEVSVTGDVFRKEHTSEKGYRLKRIQVKPYRDRGGYLNHKFQRNGKWVHEAVHRIVAKAYIPNPEDLPQVNHINENKEDNRVENLEWCTNQYNSEYSTAKRYLFEYKGQLVKVFNLNKFCKDNNLSTGCMCRVASGDLSQHKGYRIGRPTGD